DASIAIGFLSGSLDSKHPGTWTAGALDWWFLADPSDVDASGNPLASLSPASITSYSFTGGPNNVVVRAQLGTTYNTIDLRDAMMQGSIAPGPPPNAPAPPPSALAPGFATFQSVTANQANQGLCGAVTVASLAAMPVPEELTSGVGQCIAACPGSKSYTS